MRLTTSTAWVRELTPSARSTAATWSFTVSTDTFSSRAISLLGRPLSSRLSTSVCRGVRPSVAMLRRGWSASVGVGTAAPGSGIGCSTVDPAGAGTAAGALPPAGSAFSCISPSSACGM